MGEQSAPVVVSQGSRRRRTVLPGLDVCCWCCCGERRGGRRAWWWRGARGGGRGGKALLFFSSWSRGRRRLACLALSVWVGGWFGVGGMLRGVPCVRWACMDSAAAVWGGSSIEEATWQGMSSPHPPSTSFPFHSRHILGGTQGTASPTVLATWLCQPCTDQQVCFQPPFWTLGGAFLPHAATNEQKRHGPPPSAATPTKEDCMASPALSRHTDRTSTNACTNHHGLCGKRNTKQSRGRPFPPQKL